MDGARRIKGDAPAAVLAARRQGQKVGLFVEQAVRRVATEVLQGAALPAPRQEELLERILGQMQTMTTQNASLAERVMQLEQQRTAEIEQVKAARRSFLSRLFARR